MNPEQSCIHIHGEAFLDLEIVAECYQVQVDWLTEVYDLGLLGRGERVEAHIAIPVIRLDRVARIIRLHFHYGYDLSSLELLLADEDLDDA